MRLETNSSCNLSIGQIVKSKAGRDKQESFIVYEILNDNYVLIVDGRLRKISKPKKKKVKHLQKTNIIIDGFSEMKEDRDFNDSLIRRLINEERIQEET